MKILWLIFLFYLLHSNLSAQSSEQYVVAFKDKTQSNLSIQRPEEFLSQRAINRRFKQGISVVETDLPISPKYLDEIKSIPSITILSKSKWFNDVVVESSDTAIINKLAKKEFVKSITRIPGSNDKNGRRVRNKTKVNVTNDGSIRNDQYGSSFRQISMMNGDYLHQLGYRGQGMRIAIIDAGFSEAPESKHLSYLLENDRIIDVYDFVDHDRTVYEHSIHGYYVLTTMASYLPGVMIGTSPEAEFILLRSEDGSGEYLMEEYFWTEAAEFADSAGADLINTSLGYSLFDDTLQNHSFSDLNGQTTRISLSAQKAFETGMLLFNSAGNEGNSNWQKIIAPADAENVISVGAVDSSAVLAFFSSRGPTADNRIKPNLMAMGQKVIVGAANGTAVQSNGTSFSSPVLTGVAACLWQANPDKNWKEIRDALLKSGDRYSNPDTNYGNGIPNFILADDILNGRKERQKFGNESISLFPNPFIDQFVILFRLTTKQTIDIEIFSVDGKLVGNYRKEAEGGSSSYIYFQEELNQLAPGLYLLRLKSVSLNTEIKLIKQ